MRMRKSNTLSKILMVLLSVAVLVGFYASNLKAEETVVPAGVGNTISETFPDPNLAQTIANMVSDGDTDAEFTQAMIDDITYLDLGYQLIEDTTGLELLINITSLDASSNDWTTLPSNITLLTNLESLNLYNNKLTSLPDEFGNLTKIQNLNLYSNKISVLPDSFGNLSNLETLDMSMNNLGSIPPNFEKLSSLKNLTLYGNSLTSLPDEFSQLSSLSYLNLQSNKLTTLPSNFGDLKTLTVLSAPDNQLTELPDSIGDLSNLISLDVSYNKLTALPDSIGDLSSLESLNAGVNQYTELPDTIGNLSSLKYLGVYSSNLTALPNTIGNISTLERLVVYSNKLTELPATIGQLKQLTYIDAQLNKLTHLPDTIGDASGLEELFVSYNQITSLPDSITQLTSLRNLLIQGNLISHLPASIGSMSALEVLYAENNQLTSLPTSIAQLTNISQFRLDKNLLPTGYATTLNTLGLSYNFDEEVQLQLILRSYLQPYTIKSEADFQAIDLFNASEVYNATNGGARTSVTPSQQLTLVNYVDENNQPVNINDYFENGKVIKTGKVYAQVRATGTGLFPNNSDRAITSEKVELNFVETQTTYTLSFDLNGASGNAPSSQELLEGETSSEVEEPLRTGFTFKGWNTQPDASGEEWITGVTLMPNHALTLYAIWEADADVTYVLSFDLNGKAGIVPAAQVLHEGEIGTKVVDPVQAGFTFKEWNTQSDGNGNTWTLGVTPMLASDVTLFAIWLENPVATYTLSFDLNGSEGQTPASQKLAVGDFANEPVNPTRDGYVFKGWSNQQTGIQELWDFTKTTMTANDVVLYAQWELEETKKPLIMDETSAPQTGDHTNVTTLSIILLGAGSVLLFLAKRKMKKNETKELPSK